MKGVRGGGPVKIENQVEAIINVMLGKITLELYFIPGILYPVKLV